MIKSKAWDWSKNEDDSWLIPSIESCYLANSWASKGFHRFLDLGCGLGRHSIFFAENGFRVNSVDLSEYGINHLNNWAKKEELDIETQVCDMLELPFENDTFDCVIAYNVIYHSDTKGFIKALDEIKRVLKSKGELFITLISKNTWSYQHADNYKRIDDNTILRDEHETEKDVPHFYVDIEDIKKYFADFDFIDVPIEQTKYCLENSKYYSRHFNIIARKK
ncbi:class I SAM-dependent methyltransferase [Vallitalea guaymasensis]|uniref:class I SAM-dependent methyltransferase n=1 Tax=Vallitalea guaymasensis TaxID=1185412 RepID=UPI0023564D5A|nr:class I SAM-dependent methyltransferase [Vallitalea guaymasensis]